MPNTKDYNDIEDIILKIVEKLNPINLKTGEKCTPSEHEWTNAIETAVQDVLVIIDRKVQENINNQ